VKKLRKNKGLKVVLPNNQMSRADPIPLHLTIDEKVLGSGCCPECQEVYGVRRRDFEEVKTKDEGAVVYCCEDCGTLISIE